MIRMTADSLKSFITLPTTTVYKQKPRNWSSLSFSICIVISCVVLLIAQIWLATKTVELSKEVDHLNKRLDEMRKCMGLDLLDDLDEFENAYDPDKTHSNNIPLYDSDDEDDLDNSLDDFEDDLDPLDDIPDGSGVPKLGLDNDDNDDDEYDNESIYDEIRKSRRTRSIPSPHGVPVIEESYALRRNRTNTPTDDYIANILLNRKHESPKLKYDWKQRSQVNPNLNQSPRRHFRKYDEHRSSPTLYVNPPATLTIREDHSHSNQYNQIRHHQQQQQQHQQEYQKHQHRHHAQDKLLTTKEPESIQSRESRVMPTNEDKSKAFRQVMKKNEYAKMKGMHNGFLEHVAPPERFAYPPNMAVRQKSLNGRVRQGPQRHRSIAAHFDGDTSRYIVGRHEQYEGNSRLRHIGGVYVDWNPSSWVNSLAMDRFFKLDSGVLTVKEAGLYYVYAQIYYHDDHDTNGFVIEHNDQPLSQCTAMTHSVERVRKSNTCYTGTVVYINADDTLKVVDLGSHRYTLHELAKSFFGLMKMSDGRMSLHHVNGARTSGDGYLRH